jgi:hypothetical protein
MKDEKKAADLCSGPALNLFSILSILACKIVFATAAGYWPSRIMRPPSPSIPEKEFFARALAEGLRLDGRSAFELRAPVITFGTELGMVEVALGKTRWVVPTTTVCLSRLKRHLL